MATLEYYAADLRRCRFLTRDEERDLAERARAGDVDARNRMVEGVLPLAFRFAKRFCASRRRGVRLDEAVSTANAALIRAAELFDPSLGWRFATYAGRAVWTALQREAKSAGRRAEVRSLTKRDGGSIDAADPSDEADHTATAAALQQINIVRGALLFLDDRSRDILTRRAEGETLGEIGEHYNISIPRVRALEQRALDELRAMLVSDPLRN